MIDYLGDVAYEVPEECPYCGHKDFGDAEKKGPHIALQCRNCGGWTFARQCKAKNWAQMVKQRADWKCERCGKQVQGRGAHAHHKMPVWYMPKLEFDIDNGICLCTECHKLIHGGCGTIRETEETNETN